MSTVKQIGLLIDAFDPPHAGHLRVAEKMLKNKADEVWLLPTLQGADATAEHRSQMCHLAVKGNKCLKVRETALKHPGTTEEILERLQKKNPDVRFILPGRSENEAWAAESRKIRDRLSAFEDPEPLNEKVLCYIAENGLYIPNRLPELSSMISEKRLRHTLGVRKTAVQLAVLHKGPIMKSAVAALMHDCAKGLPDAVLLKMADEHCPVAQETGMHTYPVLHGPVGAYLAKEKFGISDHEILNAIVYHTVGRPGMTKLDLIIFVADAIEPNREEYPTLQAIRKAAKKSLAKAAYISIRGTCDYLKASGKQMDPASYATIEDLKLQLGGKNKKTK